MGGTNVDHPVFTIDMLDVVHLVGRLMCFRASPIPYEQFVFDTGLLFTWSKDTLICPQFSPAGKSMWTSNLGTAFGRTNGHYHKRSQWVDFTGERLVWKSTDGEQMSHKKLKESTASRSIKQYHTQYIKTNLRSFKRSVRQCKSNWFKLYIVIKVINGCINSQVNTKCSGIGVIALQSWKTITVVLFKYSIYYNVCHYSVFFVPCGMYFQRSAGRLN